MSQISDPLFRSRGRRPVRLGGALQRGTRRFAPLVDRPASLPCIAGPARMLVTDTRSRDRPCGAPLVRFCPLQRSPATPRLRRFSYPMMPLIGRCRFGVRRPALLAPRVRPALPQPIRPPMRFFARRPRRDPRPEGAGVPVIRGRRRHGSCVVRFIGGDVPLPAPEARGPAGTLRCVPAALMGFVPSQCCSCPRGFGGVVRPVVAHLPFRDASAPIIFVGGSAVSFRNSI